VDAPPFCFNCPCSEFNCKMEGQAAESDLRMGNESAALRLAPRSGHRPRFSDLEDIRRVCPAFRAAIQHQQAPLTIGAKAFGKFWGAGMKSCTSMI